jgi:hypothetical protein
VISVAIPVGPFPSCVRWLDQALWSVRRQTMPAAEIILIDDMAGLKQEDYPDCTIWRAPWLLGCAAGWNIGIALAKTDLVFMMASDDSMEAGCLEACWVEWQRRKNLLGYYHVTIRYCPEEGMAAPQDLIQDLPCNAAMVHKELWRHTGGFPPEVAVGAPDAAFISVLMVNHDAGELIPVAPKTPLYNVRLHWGQDTACRLPYQGAVLAVRNLLKDSWREPKWGRKEA